jgi:hypothetical protein
MRILILAACSLSLAACAPVPPSSEPTPVPQRCDAGAARSLIGTHIGAVTFPRGTEVRIVCTTCPTTKDLRPNRLNVRFNQATGIIERVDCG